MIQAPPSPEILLVINSDLRSGDHDAEAHAEGEGERESRHEFEHGRHHLAAFVGGATRFSDHGDETGLALGVEYEYRLSRLWGAGLLGEGVVTEHGRDAVFLAMASLHPYRGLRFTAGPGAELGGGAAEFAFRLGLGYEFEFGRFTLAPEVAADFTREATTLLYGLSVGASF